MGLAPPQIRVGISGWRYPPWRGVFYPKDLVQRRELEYASRRLNSIEINGSFYSLQHPASYQRWFESTPEDFLFSVKGPRYITHTQRLKNPKPALANFFGSGVLHLREKLGPILWQLPPSFLFRLERLDQFFKQLPRTESQAARLGQTAKRVNPDFPESAKKSKRRLRFALEVRHPSFENPELIDLLREHDIALVFADTAGRWPYMEDLTSDFVYGRLHGDVELYKSGYDDGTLFWWAQRIRKWSQGEQPRDALTMSDRAPKKQKRDIFIYFDNDVKVRAPFDAERLGSAVADLSD